MLTEIREIHPAWTIGLPGGLFADVAPRVLAGLAGTLPRVP